ncbi:ABC transporter permease [Euzebya tangerina]|uniref:ABC transporter permease n=1 Tax=Euzebya tangerina TaxID=591198 RepID=UPI000E320EE9|nr:ABC transporter permease [Euzebya tangerina]
MSAATATTTAGDQSLGDLLSSVTSYVRANRWITLSIVPIVIAILGYLLLDAMALFDEAARENLRFAEQRVFNPAQIRRQFAQHVTMTAYSTGLVVAFAIPLGIFLTRPSARRIAEPVLAVASSGQAVPAYGLLVLFAIFFGLGFGTAVYALAVYSILPVLRNTMVGLRQVDPKVVEAARGMGLTKRQVLRRIELPLAVPIILAGLRTALIINVGTAVLGTYIRGGGLGEIITAGLELREDFVTFAGAALAALLAMSIDWLAAVAEYTLSPKGLR